MEVYKLVVGVVSLLRPCPIEELISTDPKQFREAYYKIPESKRSRLSVFVLEKYKDCFLEKSSIVYKDTAEELFNYIDENF